MLIIWKGWGIIAGLIWLGCIMVVTGVTHVLFDDPDYFRREPWPVLLASFMATPIIWVVGRSMNGQPDSEERQFYGTRHSLFFVPMEYWGPIFFGFALLFAFSPPLTHDNRSRTKSPPQRIIQQELPPRDNM